MLEIIRLLANPDVYIWVYIILGGIATLLGRSLWLAQRERSRSVFALEREHANNQMTTSLIWLMIIMGLGFGLFYLTQSVDTRVPPPDDRPTATPTPPVEIPPSPTPPTLLPTPTRTPTSTATPPPLPLEDGLPTFTPPPSAAQQPAELPRPQAQPAVCPTAGVQIFQPSSGAAVDGLVQVQGSATHDNFQYYKFEFRVPGNEWAFIARYDAPVPSGVLGAWNSDTVPPGSYEFRLVVVDQSGNYPTPCVIQLNVQ